MLPLTLLRHCCTRCKNSNKFGFNSLAGVFGNRTPHGTITAPLPEGAVRNRSTACDDGTFMFPKESRRAMSRSD